MCNSDGHKGRPGASYPGASEFGSYGGLTCILAPELTRAALWDALIRRHHYGTTGARIHLEVQAAVNGVRLDDDPRTGAVARTPVRDAAMGDIIATAAAELELAITVRGTAPLLAVEVRNGTRTVETLRTYGAADLGRRLRVRWAGAAFRGRGRQVAWDGTLTIAGNRIDRIAYFNFLNPDRQPVPEADGSVRWQSTTTGGLCRHRLLAGRRRRPDAGRHGAVDLRGNWLLPGPGRVEAPGTDCSPPAGWAWSWASPGSPTS